MAIDTYSPGFRKVLLLKIKCARRYQAIDRFTAHDFIHQGTFRSANEVETYIRNAESTENIISKSVAPGIDTYSVGDNPDYYIAFDIIQVPPHPLLIARLTVA